MGKQAILGRILTAAIVASSAVPAGQARAQETPPAPGLQIELNAAQPTDTGCRLTFMVTNALGGELASAAFELVLFDAAGMVARMTIVDFKDLPDGKTKVRQFDFSGLDCAGLGRVLVNDATECVGEGIDPKACIRALATRTKLDIAFGT